MQIRTTTSFKVSNTEIFKQQMLSWANRFNICCLLDNHQYSSDYHSVECLLAIHSVKHVSVAENSLPEIDAFITETNDWIFGHINYDFKNYLETSKSNHFNGIHFPDLFLFQPETVIELKKDEVTISSLRLFHETIYHSILEEQVGHNNTLSCNIQSRFSKKEYIDTIYQLHQNILRGDCYEINFCQEFFSEEAMIDPIQTYHKLVNISPTPFASYYKWNDQYLLCASPERFLKKIGNKIISQPIKGTYKRDLLDSLNDEKLKQQLQSSEKEKSENVMIVDLVRNDLSKICEEGTVVAEELFGVQSFPQVHQMISTISGELREEISFTDILKATFPMGSMTGAPKKRVIELIEQYEKTKRGIYSGCVGYVSPDKDFDFNVVIRSIMYNQHQKYLNYQVGSGITFKSKAENEYEECMMKAEAIKKVLQSNT
jgi:para-aminobenzoate synthetase component 1